MPAATPHNRPPPPTDNTTASGDARGRDLVDHRRVAVPDERVVERVDEGTVSPTRDCASSLASCHDAPHDHLRALTAQQRDGGLGGGGRHHLLVTGTSSCRPA
ncbi:MAG: hypothetical protein U0P30_14370 [Vicinamibacterales bacterium]